MMARDAEQRAASEASGALHAALTGALQAELLGLGAATAQTPEAAAAAAAATTARLREVREQVDRAAALARAPRCGR
ncbi:hypothetical protein ACFQU7_21995 [Pseudoroseomonas wenyumeiae]